MHFSLFLGGVREGGGILASSDFGLEYQNKSMFVRIHTFLVYFPCLFEFILFWCCLVFLSAFMLFWRSLMFLSAFEGQNNPTVVSFEPLEHVAPTSKVGCKAPSEKVGKVAFADLSLAPDLVISCS